MTERILPGPYRVAHAAASCVERVTQAAADLVRQRGTDPGPVSVDVRHAAAVFRSERYLLVDGVSPGNPGRRCPATTGRPTAG